MQAIFAVTVPFFALVLLGWLAQGQWRYLDAREVTALAGGSVRGGTVREVTGPPRGGGSGRAR